MVKLLIPPPYVCFVLHIHCTYSFTMYYYYGFVTDFVIVFVVFKPIHLSVLFVMLYLHCSLIILFILFVFALMQCITFTVV